MAFETLLVSLAACLMAWIIQTENGGVLNILFKPDQFTAPDDPTFSPASEWDYNYIIDFLLLKPLNFPVLRAIPERFGGGQKAVDAANANPNREPILFWIVIVILLFLMLLLICTTCCCACRCSNRKSAITTKEKFARHQQMGRMCYIILVIFAIIIALASTCFLIFYFGTLGFAFSATEQTSNEKEQSICLLEGIQTAIDEILSFVKEGIATFPVLVSASLTDFMDKVDVKLSVLFPKTVDNLLTRLNLLSFRDNGSAVVNSMSILLTNAEKALQDIGGIKGDLISLEIKMTTSNNQFKTAFANVQNCNYDQVCSNLKAVAENLALPFNPNQIDTVNLQAAVSQLENLQTDLKDQVDKYTNSIGVCSEMAKNVSTILVDKIDVRQIKEVADNFTNALEVKVNDILSQVQKSINLVNPQIMKYKEFAIIVLYSIGGFIALLVFIAIITLIRLIYLAWRYRIFSDQNALEIPANKWESVVYGKGSAWCCSISLIFILFLSSVSISILLLLLTVIAGEGCIYVTEDGAMKKTDVVLNGFISTRWESVIGSANTELISRAPPKDILQALANLCQESSVGLFSACKIQSLFNRTAVVHGPEIQKAISKGEELLLSEIKRINFGSMIPGQADIDKLKKDLAAAFNHFNGILTGLLANIDPNRIDDTDIENLISDLNVFINTPLITQKDDFNAGLQALEEVKSLMAALKICLLEVRTSVQSIRTDVANLESQISSLFDRLADSLNAVSNDVLLTSETKSQYDDFVIQLYAFLETNDFYVFNHLTQELFPCQNAHKAYRAAMSVTCDSSGTINHSIGFILIFAFTILFLILVYVALFSLASYQTLQAQMLKKYIQHNNQNRDNGTVIPSIVKTDK